MNHNAVTLAAVVMFFIASMFGIGVVYKGHKYDTLARMVEQGYHPLEASCFVLDNCDFKVEEGGVEMIKDLRAKKIIKENK